MVLFIKLFCLFSFIVILCMEKAIQCIIIISIVCSFLESMSVVHVYRHGRWFSYVWYHDIIQKRNYGKFLWPGYGKYHTFFTFIHVCTGGLTQSTFK